MSEPNVASEQVRLTDGLFRVRYGIRRGATSWGEWRYYEGDTASLTADLLEAHLGVEIDHGKTRGSHLSILRQWLNRVGGRFGEECDVVNLFAVEVREGDEWVPVNVEFITPEVRLFRGGGDEVSQ
jgi:hypothetical protein